MVWLLLAMTMLAPVQENQPLVLVVCPPALQESLDDWIDYRQHQGYSIQVIAPGEDAEATRFRILQQSRRQTPAAIMLVGKPKPGPAFCPVGIVSAEVNVQFGSTLEIATDNLFADFDGDGKPEVPIGRLPVESAEMASQLLARTIKYETTHTHGDWRRRINLVAGVGGFDPTMDRVIEGAAESVIRTMMPEDYSVSMTWGSWTSPYCPDPRQFSQTAIERFNEGCLFWVYIGHGFIDRLDRVKTPGGNYSILDNTTVPWLSSTNGSPVALMLCCFTAAFDARADSLGQKMLEQPHGPVAVVGGTRMTMPYGMTRMSVEMMDELFNGECKTLGELLHLAKRRTLEPARSGNPSDCREMIKSIAKMFSPNSDKLEVELQEHVAMMHLLGDPLLQLHRPLKIETEITQASAGETVIVRGVAPVAGTLIVEACYERGRFYHRPQRRRAEDLDPASSEKLQADYELCRDRVCSSHTVQVPQGPFEIELPIPENARGEAVIRTFIDGQTSHAVGVAAISIEPLKR